jgi:hypothetical protein
MPVKLTDKVFTEAGSPVQGAVAQAILTDGTTAGTVTATDTTDIKGIWAFDSAIAGHQADLADPPAGSWYDVRINVGMQYRLRYGAIKAMMNMVYLAQNIVLGASQTLDASLARLRLPVKAADPSTPGAGEILLRSDSKLLRFYDGAAWQNLGNPESAYVGSLQTTSVNYTVPIAGNVMYVWCQVAGLTITLTAPMNRPVTIRSNTGSTTVISTSGSVIGGSVNTTTGAVQNGIIASGDAITYKWDGANWASV